MKMFWQTYRKSLLSNKVDWLMIALGFCAGIAIMATIACGK